MPERLSPEIEGQHIACDLILTEDLSGEDETETASLRQMSKEAERYITSFTWCDTVRASYFAGGVGGVFAIFFFYIRPARPEVDPWIWIVVGDIPSAYLPVSDCNSPSQVFDTYVSGMNRWVESARLGRDGSEEPNMPPVNVPATPEWAQELDKRLQVLNLVIRPVFRAESDTRNETIN